MQNLAIIRALDERAEQYADHPSIGEAFSIAAFNRWFFHANGQPRCERERDDLSYAQIHADLAADGIDWPATLPAWLHEAGLRAGA